MALHNLPAGVYYMKVIRPPTGYIAGDERYSFYVATGQTVDVLAVMQRIVIPKTGGDVPVGELWVCYSLLRSSRCGVCQY